jgi:protein gp37
MKADWVRGLKKRAEEAGAAFFFKGWGAWGPDGVKRNKKANGHLLDGQEFRNWPSYGPVSCDNNG